MLFFSAINVLALTFVLCLDVAVDFVMAAVDEYIDNAINVFEVLINVLC